MSSITFKKIDNDTINLVFNIFEGEKKTVERINVKGNSVTNENVIRGELLLDEEDPFTKINLEKSIAKIKSRNIFSQVDYKINDGSENNLKSLKLKLRKVQQVKLAQGLVLELQEEL